MVISAVVGMVRFKQLNTALRFIVAGLILTMLSETANFIIVSLHKYDVRYTVYHFYDILQSFITTAYFIYILRPLDHRKLMMLSAVFWPLVGIANILFLQPLGTMNTNMLMVESFVFITLSLYLIYITLKNDKVENIFRYPHFWMAVLFIITYSSSFFYWAFLELLFQGKWKYRILILYLQSVLEVIVYLGMAFILFYYNKKMEVNDKN